MKAKGLVITTVLTSAISLMSAKALASAPPTASAPILSTSTLSDLKVPNMWYVPHLDVGGYYFKNDPKGAGLVNLFLPVYQTANRLSFAQLRSYSRSEGNWEGNASFGYRQLSQNQQTMWGVAASYDHLTTGFGGLFNQISLNGVMWHNNWTVNGNVYLPIGDTLQQDSKAQGVKLVQNGAYKNIYAGAGFAQAMRGVDLSVGNNVWKGLTVYGGLYYYNASNDKAKNIFGPDVNADYTWYAPQGHKISGLFDRITAQAQVQHDGVHGTNAYAGVLFTILLPGQHSNLTGVARHMIDPINRDMNITTEAYHEPLALLVKHNGQAVRVRDVSNAAQLAQALADKNADVIAIDGTINGLATQTINRSVYLTGGDYGFDMQGERFDAKVGNNGVLGGVADQNLLSIANTASLAGDTITIRDLTLNVITPGTFAMTTAGTASFGQVNVLGDTMTGRVSFALSGAGATGSVDMANNNIDVPAFTQSDNVVGFDAAQGAVLTVTHFDDNTVTGHSRTAVHNDISAGAGDIIYNSFVGNTINVEDAYTDTAYAALFNDAAGDFGSIIFNGDFSNNHIESESGYGILDQFGGSGVNGAQDAHIVFNADLNDNTLIGEHDQGLGNFIGFDTRIGEDGSGDTITFSNVTDNIIQGGFGALMNDIHDSNSAILYNGNFSGNELTELGTTVSPGSSSVMFNGLNDTAGSSRIEFKGSFDNNHLTSNRTDGTDDYGLENTVFANTTNRVQYDGSFSGNVITTHKGAALYLSAWNKGRVIFNGVISHNQFSVADATVAAVDVSAPPIGGTDDGIFAFNGGFVNNTLSAGGFNFTAGTGSIYVKAASEAALEASNGGAAITKTGAVTIAPTPPSQFGGALFQMADLFERFGS